MGPLNPKVIVLTGPTGSGKSSLAIELASIFRGAIINGDSLSVYRGLDIGTAKPTLAERSLVPHYLFDILEPDEDFDSLDYLSLARPLIKELTDKGYLPIVVGGSGLYLRSLLKGVFFGPGRDPVYREHLRALETEGVNLHELLQQKDPKTAARLHPHDRIRIERALEVFHQEGQSISDLQEKHALSDRVFDSLQLVIELPTPVLDIRLQDRVNKMFELGIVAETENLLNRGFSPELKPLQSIGYREVISYLRGENSLEETKAKVYLRTRRFAKRQRSWFRGQMPEAIRVENELDKIKSEVVLFLEEVQNC
jgi:tRNA dimethylallyltransferase